MDRIKVKKIVAYFIIRKKYYSIGNEQIDLIHNKVNKNIQLYLSLNICNNF